MSVLVRWTELKVLPVRWNKARSRCASLDAMFYSDDFDASVTPVPDEHMSVAVEAQTELFLFCSHNVRNTTDTAVT